MEDVYPGRGSDIELLSGGGRKNYPVNVRRPAARLITTNLPVPYKQKQVPHKFSAGYIVDVIMTTKLAQINYKRRGCGLSILDACIDGIGIAEKYLDLKYFLK